MNRWIQGLALGLASSGLLLASALPAAAQPGGPCTLAPDAAVWVSGALAIVEEFGSVAAIGHLLTNE